MRAGLQPRQDAIGEIKRVGNANKAETRVAQVRPFKDGVEDILGFAVKLVHFIQDKKPGERKPETQSPHSASAGTPYPNTMTGNSHGRPGGRQEPL